MPLKSAKSAYAVSTLTLELPARSPRAFQPDHYKINGHPAFHLTTVLVTLFYPTDRAPQPVKKRSAGASASADEKIKRHAADAAVHSGEQDEDEDEDEDGHTATHQTKHSGDSRKQSKAPKPLHWLNTPRLRTIEGLLKFAGLPKWAALPVILPAYRAFHARLPYESNAPLSTRLPPDDENRQPSPLVHLLRAQRDEARRTAALGGRRQDTKPVFPCAVFSHGLGGTRVAYSAYAAALASHGVVVAAIEHRDGTAPATSICTRVNAEGSATGSQAADSKDAAYWEESLIWLSMKDLDPDEKVNPKDFLTARKAQLLLRRAEFIEALSVLRRLNEGHGNTLEQECLRTHYSKKTVGPPSSKNGPKPGGEGGTQAASSTPSRVRKKQGDGVIVETGAAHALNLQEWKGRLDIENAWALGHSFGAATVIEVMRCACTPPSLELDPSKLTNGGASSTTRPEERTTLLHPTHAEVQEAQAFKHALVLDPWTEPIEDRGRAQKLTRPLFCINSEAFTAWHQNFDPLRELLQEAAQNNRTGEGWLVTLSKTRHTDFSDYPYVLKTLFGSEVSAKECTRVFAGLTILQMVARASTARAPGTGAPLGPTGGAQAQEGPGEGPTSVQADAIQDSLAALANGKGNASGPKSDADHQPRFNNADGPYASFWAGVDALMNSNGNGGYRLADQDKAKYAHALRDARLRVEWEGETDQTRLGRPKFAEDDEHSEKKKAAAIKKTKKKDGDKEEPEYGNERPGVLVIHPLGTAGSCPARLVGDGLNGAATATYDASNNNKGATPVSPVLIAAIPPPVRKLSNSVRGTSFTLTKERELSQDDRTPRRKLSRLEP